MNKDENDSEFIKHLPCNTCTSSDGMALYSDGHTHCFVCNTTIYPTNNSTVAKKSLSGDLLSGQAVSLPKGNLLWKLVKSGITKLQLWLRNCSSSNILR